MGEILWQLESQIQECILCNDINYLREVKKSLNKIVQLIVNHEKELENKPSPNQISFLSEDEES